MRQLRFTGTYRAGKLLRELFAAIPALKRADSKSGPPTALVSLLQDGSQLTVTLHDEADTDQIAQQVAQVVAAHDATTPDSDEQMAQQAAQRVDQLRKLRTTVATIAAKILAGQSLTATEQQTWERAQALMALIALTRWLDSP